MLQFFVKAFCLSEFPGRRAVSDVRIHSDQVCGRAKSEDEAQPPALMKKGDFGGVLKKATITARRFLQCPDMVRTCYRS